MIRRAAWAVAVASGLIVLPTILFGAADRPLLVMVSTALFVLALVGLVQAFRGRRTVQLPEEVGFAVVSAFVLVYFISLPNWSLWTKVVSLVIALGLLLQLFRVALAWFRMRKVGAGIPRN